MDHVEVNVVTLPMEEWIRDYYRPGEFADACKLCPNYGRVWSCPPLMHQVPQMLKPFARVHLVGVKVVYKKETIAAVDSAEKADRVRIQTYDRVKRIFLQSLLELEKAVPGSWSLAAGECKLCKKCARQDGLPCRHPDKMRFSFSGFGFDLTRIAHDLFHYELLWSPNGLPEYTVAFGAFLDRGDLGLQQSFGVRDSRPWDLLKDQVLGVLSQLGCKAEHREVRESQNVYFDTPGDGLRKKDSTLQLQRQDSRVSLIWTRNREREPEGLNFPRTKKLDLAEAEEGSVADFVRQQLDAAELLLPNLETEDRQDVVTLADSSTGEAYTLIFHDLCCSPMPGQNSRRDHRLELVSDTGSGRRIRQLASCLRARFPELTPDEL